MSAIEAGGARRGTGRRRPSAGAAAAPEVGRSRAYRHLVNPFEPVRLFSDDHVAAMHEAALTLLETQGMKVLSAPARARYAQYGAKVDEAAQVVRIDRGLVAKALATTPGEFTFRTLEPEFSVKVGGRSVVFACTSGPPNVADTVSGRRPGTMDDFRNFVRLSQAFDVVHSSGGAVEPQDVPVHLRHYEMMRSQLVLSNKVPFLFARGSAQIADGLELLRIAHGIDAGEFRREPRVWTVINTNSPLQLDIPMAEGIIDFAEAGQVLIITPFTLAGAMAPVTVAGALTLAHAEALAGITLAQMVNPGVPLIYGSFTSNVDMKSGSPAFGTPEYAKAAFGAGQLARYIKVPWRSSNATASNVVDAQAAYESQMSLWGPLMGGANFLLHAAGWLEGGLTASYEKFILDVEMLQMFAELFQPVGASAADIALDAVSEAGHGGHFFSTSHTMERYRTAFYTPLVSDWRNFGQWSADGSKTATERALTVWQDTLAGFVPPERDPAIVEEMDAYIAKRIEAGGALAQT
jgi:trimethylamine--corrinoid protein Co-methyltransferase